MPSVAVGLTQDLPNGRVMRAQIGSQDLVVWRSRGGQISAWDNRCPHRGMRLSHGFVRGEALACVYHGWHYDGKGACRYIPAHPELDPPETIKTVAFHVADQHGLIWVDLEGSLDIPSIEHDLLPLRSIVFHAGVERVQKAIKEFNFQTCDGDLRNFDIKQQEPDMWVIGFETTHIWCHIFFQKLPGDKSASHVLCSSNCTSEQQKDLSRFLEQLRRTCEKAEMVPA